MDRGFRFYSKEGMRTSKKVIKGRKISKMKFLFMVIASFLSRLLILPGPLFTHAKIRLAKSSVDKNVYEITHAFEDADSYKAYWTTMIASFAKVLLLLSGVVFIGAITFGLYFVGTVFANMTGITLLGILFAVPGFIALLIYFLGFSLSVRPLNYYINNDNNINVGKAFGASTRSMKEQGKRTLFFIDFFYYLPLALYIGVAFFVSRMLILNPNSSIKAIGLVAVVLFAIIFLLILPRLGMAHQISTLLLMNDIMIDPEEADDLSLIKEKMVRKGLSKDEFLVELFDKKMENGEEEADNSEETKEEAKEEDKSEEQK